ncbi:MAG: hypothetical protein U0841_18750 [Chloroflexia bacterium]
MTTRGGVWLLDLAALHDGALLDATLARVIGPAPTVRATPARTGHRRAEGSARAGGVGHRDLIAACADPPPRCWRGCPELRILATSREALRVAAVRPGGAEPAGARGDARLAALRDTPAVGLFLDRARFACPGFALTAENALAVATICRRLDGIPWRRELAAARIPVLAPQQLASRLDDAAAADRGVAHRRCRATRPSAPPWSGAIGATAAERSLLDRLAVFAGVVRSRPSKRFSISAR